MTRFSLIVLRSFGIASVLCLVFASALQGQQAGKVAEWLESYRLSGDFQTVQPLVATTDRSALQTVVDNATILEADLTALNQLLKTAPLTLTFSIPNAHGANFELELVKVDLLAPDFSLGTLGANAQENHPYQQGVHYRGIARGNPYSLAALSVFDDGIMAMVSDESGTFQVGKMEDGSGQHILYRKEDLKADVPFGCFADDDALIPDDEPSAGDRGVGCKTVQVYFECDYKLYTDKGSNLANATNYVTGLFNQVATLYANENVGIAISQIYIWTSPDPYQGYSSTSAVLNAFRNNRGTNFNGNLAHFLSTRNLGGGIAYLDVICFKSYAYGVSGISASYQNVPTYSWTVEVVTHELGHNLGSWHTHSCNWPNGALDNCYSPEGNCSPGPAPSNGGTIMSYCHLKSYGINFNNGFGPVPGNRIRDRVLAATCLPSSGAIPTGLNATNITATSASLTWGGVAGATNYTVQYKTSASSTWLTAGTSTTPAYNLTGLTANTAYNWRVKTDCSDYSATANFTTNNSSGGGNSCSAPTGLTTTNITSSSAKLNWNASASATSYTVQFKRSSVTTWSTAGTTSSTTFNLNSLLSGTTYNWRVKANCSADYSAQATFSTLSGDGGGGTGACNPPTVLNNVKIGPNSALINWTAVNGASSYTLQIKFATSNTWYTLGTVSVTQVTISGLQPSTSYHWRVKANCSGYSAQKLLTTPAGIQAPDDTEAMPNMTLTYFQLYPNPVAESLTVNYTGDIFSQSEITVSDMAGRVVLKQSLTQPQQLLDVSRLQAGTYVLSLMEGETRITTERFVKM
ncbi:MAG: fibronectin type III domain-containing protein [Saprospiraceae bacterium]|nr:fibronectin type III domain-containing protein [Saprospiraceae bacterium]